MKHALFLALVLALVACGKKEDAAPPPAPATAPVTETDGITPPAPVPGQPASGAPATAKTPGATAAPVVYATEENLKEYNALLYAWIQRTSYVPQNAKELTTLQQGCPRPPKAPPGRALVFDTKTWKVHLE